MVLLHAPAARAVVTCTAAVPSIAELDPLRTSAAVGELLLSCGGGAPADPILTVSVNSFYNVPLLQTVTPILTDGVNDYAGTFPSGNSIAFSGIPLNPVGSTFAIRQILVNPGLQAENFFYVAFVNIPGPTPVPIDDPQQIVAINGSIPGNVPEPLSGLLLATGFALLVVGRISQRCQ